VTVKRLSDLATEVKIGTPEDFGKMLDRERALWSGVVAAAHIQKE
jgi:hypothetical protein